jgi:hypothetical protein
MEFDAFHRASPEVPKLFFTSDNDLKDCPGQDQKLDLYGSSEPSCSSVGMPRVKVEGLRDHVTEDLATEMVRDCLDPVYG